MTRYPDGNRMTPASLGVAIGLALGAAALGLEPSHVHAAGNCPHNSPSACGFGPRGLQHICPPASGEGAAATAAAGHTPSSPAVLTPEGISTPVGGGTGMATPAAGGGGAQTPPGIAMVVGTELRFSHAAFELESPGFRESVPGSGYEVFVAYQELANGGHNSFGYFTSGPTSTDEGRMKAFPNLPIWFHRTPVTAFTYVRGSSKAHIGFGIATALDNGRVSDHPDAPQVLLGLRVQDNYACLLPRYSVFRVPAHPSELCIRDSSVLDWEVISGALLSTGWNMHTPRTGIRTKFAEFSPIVSAFHGMEARNTGDDQNNVHVQYFENRQYYFGCGNCLEHCDGNYNVGVDPNWSCKSCDGNFWNDSADNNVIWDGIDPVVEHQGYDVFDPERRLEINPLNDPTTQRFDICKGMVPFTPCHHSREYAVVSWINADTFTMDPTGVSPDLLSMTGNGDASVNLPGCTALLLAWSLGQPLAIHSEADGRWATDWMMLPGDPEPPSVMDRAYLEETTRWRVSSRLKLGSNHHGMFADGRAVAGMTHFPCGLEFVNGAVDGVLRFPSDPGPHNDQTIWGPRSVSKVAEGRIGQEAWVVDATINKCGPLEALGFCSSFFDAIGGELTPFVWAVLRLDTHSTSLAPPAEQLIVSPHFNTFDIYEWRLGAFHRIHRRDQDPTSHEFAIQRADFQFNINMLP